MNLWHMCHESGSSKICHKPALRCCAIRADHNTMALLSISVFFSTTPFSTTNGPVIPWSVMESFHLHLPFEDSNLKPYHNMKIPEAQWQVVVPAGSSGLPIWSCESYFHSHHVLFLVRLHCFHCLYMLSVLWPKATATVLTHTLHGHTPDSQGITTVTCCFQTVGSSSDQEATSDTLLAISLGEFP